MYFSHSLQLLLFSYMNGTCVCMHACVCCVSVHACVHASLCFCEYKCMSFSLYDCVLCCYLLYVWSLLRVLRCFFLPWLCFPGKTFASHLSADATQLEKLFYIPLKR